MQRLFFLFAAVALLLASRNANTQVQIAASPTPTTFPHDPPASCPVTRPPDPPFVPPAPYSANAPSQGEFWYGSDALWTALPQGGAWSSLPYDPQGYAQKIFWWRKGYSIEAEPQPELSLIGERLDASAPTFNVSDGTNAFARDIGEAMLVGVGFPSLGCWRVTGHYKDSELSFVIWIAP